VAAGISFQVCVVGEQVATATVLSNKLIACASLVLEVSACPKRVEISNHQSMMYGPSLFGAVL